MSAQVVSTTKHKYKWRFQEIFSVIFFVAIPIALYFFTPLALFLSAGTISLAIAAFLIYIGSSRKSKSALTARVYDDGVVSVSGNGLEEPKNRIKLSGVSVIKWDKYAHHPTLLLINSAGRTLKLPRRVATEEPFNTFIRKTLSKNLYIVDEAKETLAEILEESATSDESLNVIVEWDDSEEPHTLLLGSGGTGKTAEPLTVESPFDQIAGSGAGGKRVIANENSEANVAEPEKNGESNHGKVISSTKSKGGSGTTTLSYETGKSTTGAGFDELGQFVTTGAVNPESSLPIVSYAGADNAGEKDVVESRDITNINFLLGSQPAVNDTVKPVVVSQPVSIEDTISAEEFNPNKSAQRVQPRKKNRKKR